MKNQLTERRRKEIASLGAKKYRDRLGEMLVEGLRSVVSAVEAEAPITALLVSEVNQAETQVRQLLARTAAPCYVLSERDMARVSDVKTSQGIVAVVRTEMVPPERLTGLQTVVVLDGIQDPGNVGAIVRTAAWFGVGAVLAGPGSADFFNPKVIRAAMGGLWDLKLSHTENLPDILIGLRKAGFALYAADLEGSPSRRWSPRSPAALVMGSEAHGLSDAVQTLIDERIVVETAASRRGAESLNVSVAAGILLYEWLGG